MWGEEKENVSERKEKKVREQDRWVNDNVKEDEEREKVGEEPERKAGEWKENKNTL